jgi:Flp pilus assembly protein TadD
LKRLAALLGVAGAMLIIAVPVAGADEDYAASHALWEKAQACMERKDYSSAVNYLRQAVQLSPSRSTLYASLGHAYYNLEKYREAFQVLSRAYDLNPKDGYTCDKLGCVYAKLGDAPHAAMMFRKAVSLEPTEENAWIRAYMTMDEIGAKTEFNYFANEYLRRFPQGKYAQDLKFQMSRETNRTNAIQRIAQKAPYDGLIALPTKGAKASAEFVALIREGIRQMPEIIWKPLMSDGYKILVCGRVDEQIDVDPKGQPRGYAKGETYANVPALCEWDRKTIVVGEYFNRGAQPVKNTDPIESLKHEMGHAYDKYLGQLSRKTNQSETYAVFSTSNAFKAAYDADVAKISNPKDREQLNYYLQSGTAGREELFAELVSLTFEANVAPRSTDELLLKSFTTTSKAIATVRDLDPEYIRLRDLYNSHVRNFR